MMVKEYTLLMECIEDGISTGYRRAFKHTEEPGEEYIKEKIFEAVQNEICEYFEFTEHSMKE